MRTLSVLTVFLAIASSAAAQPDSVRVNLVGAGVLIDPATGQPRALPPLLQPWQNEPIRLRPPGARHRKTHVTAASAPSETPIASEPPATEPQAPPPPRRKHRVAAAPPPSETPAVSEPAATPPVAPRKKHREAAAPPPPAPLPSAPPPSAPQQKSAPVTGFSDFTDLIGASPQTKQAARAKASPPPPPPPARAARHEPPPRIAEPVRPEPRVENPVQKAAAEPAKPARSRAAAGSRKDSIAFAPNASDPTTSAVSSIRNLASTLSNALGDGNARVQLLAYAGMRGEKSSDTRRLSLKRALVVRQLLIDDGVPSERIDVFALGGVDDDGPLDRVDVMVKG
jgi:outer membrane protein OmpA-like peptidoglycan-associated protein